MAVVNVCVYHSTKLRTVVPWTIFDLQDERWTLTDLYQFVIKDVINDVEEVETRVEARIGKSKESLDPVHSLS